MSLIEVLLQYRDLVRRQGRVAANSQLQDIVNEPLQWHIEHAVNDNGQFIDADGQIIFGID